MRPFVTICVFLASNFIISGCQKEISPDQVITDALTLELSFGSEGIPDEFLLSRPGRIAVSPEGEIMVMDEDRIKVYDGNGNPVKIIGAPGQGPGEFRRSGKIMISPSGFIMAGSASGYNMFGPDHKFIRKSVFRQSKESDAVADISQIRLNDVKSYYAFSENEILLGGIGMNADFQQTGSVSYYNILVHIQGETVHEIAKYELNDTFQAGQFQADHSFLGAFYWTLLEDRVVAYSHTGYDRSENENGYSYTIHIVSLDNYEKNELSIPYTRIAIPDSLIEKPLRKTSHSFASIPMGGYPDDYYEAIRDKLREIEYFPPVDGILADGDYLFVFTYHEDYVSGEIADVIDIRTGLRVSRAFFPSRPWVIKDGYAYSTKTGSDIFPVVEKYKIDPAVYRK